MRKVLLITSFLTASALSSMAQNEYVKQYFYTAGGNFTDAKNKVKVGVILDGKDKTIDSIRGNFTNDVYIYNDKTNKTYEGIVHIGRIAPLLDLIVRYDLDTYNRIDSTTSTGVQAIARNANKLVLAKGFGSKGANIEILNAKTLKLITGIDGIYPASDVKIWGDSAFVTHSMLGKTNYGSVNNPYYLDSLGFISIINLNDNTVYNTIPFGANGAGLKGLNIYKGQDKKIHVIFNNSAVNVEMSISNLVFHALKNTDVVEANHQKIYGISKTAPNLTALVINKMTGDTSKTKSFKAPGYDGDTYGFDTVSNVFLILRTDFNSYGKLIRYSPTLGKAIDSVSVGVSATDFAIDYRQGFPTSLAVGSEESAFSVFPNPFKDQFTIQNTNNAYQNWEILNVDGILVAGGVLGNFEERISTESFSKGMYLLNLKGNRTSRSIKIIKQ